MPLPPLRFSAFNKRLERRDSAYAYKCQTAWGKFYIFFYCCDQVSILPFRLEVLKVEPKIKEKHFRLHPSHPLQPE